MSQHKVTFTNLTLIYVVTFLNEDSFLEIEGAMCFMKNEFAKILLRVILTYVGY